MVSTRQIAILGLAILALAILAAGNPAMTRVAAPALADLLILVLFWSALMRGRSSAPIEEAGLWYFGMAVAYAVIPLVEFIVLRFQYNIFNDNRLFFFQPSPDTVARVGWLYTAHLAAFAVAYVLMRGRVETESPASSPFPQSLIVAAGLVAIPLALNAMIEAMSAASYSQTYVIAASRPLLVRQFMKLADGIAIVATIALIAGWFSNYRKYRKLIWAWPAIQLAVVIFVAGSRFELMVALASCLFFYHAMVKRIPAKTALAIGMLGLVGFLGLGAYRTYRGWTQLNGVGVPGGAGEFESLFGTAVDLDTRKAIGELRDVPRVAPVADILSPIPSQLLPFEKIDVSKWYLSAYYPSHLERGQGYAFGVIAQSIIGGGLIDVMLRGLIVAVIFARLFRFYTREKQRPWVVIGYCCLTIFAYQAFRISTFALWPMFLQQFIPGMIVLEMLRALLAHASARDRNQVDTTLAPTAT